MKALLKNQSDINCDQIKKDLILNNNKYSETFDLGFDIINKMSLGILISYCIILGCSALVLIVSYASLCCGENTFAIIIACFPYIVIVTLSSGLADFVLLIILLINYYKGRTNGEFLDYYNTCLSEPEKSNISETYKKLDEIDTYMTAFVALNFIGFAFNYIGSCFIKEKKD